MNQSAQPTSGLVFIPKGSADKAQHPATLSRNVQLSVALVATLLITPLAATPALAHHAMGGNLPANFFDGFLSGVAHPLIGPDHFAFIVAAGLLAAIKPRGLLIPIAFVLAAMLGTTGHLAGFDLPGIELLISGSILLFGLLLVLRNRLSTLAVTGLSGLAGLLHGYAYGESIFGAETTPLVAYLIGFTVVQLAIALSAFWIGKAIVFKASDEQQSATKLRSAGLVICGMGLAFFGSQVIAAVFPTPPG